MIAQPLHQILAADYRLTTRHSQTKFVINQTPEKMISKTARNPSISFSSSNQTVKLRIIIERQYGHELTKLWHGDDYDYESHRGKGIQTQHQNFLSALAKRVSWSLIPI